MICGLPDRPPRYPRFEIGEQILDLLSGVEIDAADDLVRYVAHQKLFLKETGLGIGAVKDGTVLVLALSPAHPPFDISRHKFRLLIAGHKLAEADLFSLLLLRPESFFLPSFVVADDAVGSIQNSGWNGNSAPA